MFLVDTTLLVATERGKFDMRGFVAAQAEDFRMSVVTLSELIHGATRADSTKRRLEKLEFIRRLVFDFPLVPFGIDEAEIHGRLTAAQESRGQRIGAYDSMIAATALARNWSVVTLNVSEFQRVSALKVIDASPWLVK